MEAAQVWLVFWVRFWGFKYPAKPRDVWKLKGTWIDISPESCEKSMDFNLATLCGSWVDWPVFHHQKLDGQPRVNQRLVVVAPAVCGGRGKFYADTQLFLPLTASVPPVGACRSSSA